MTDLLIGGTWAKEIGPVGDFEWSERWPGGAWEASWRMDLPANFDHPALRRGARVKVIEHGAVLGQFTLNEPDRAAWSFNAAGLAREGERYYALDGSGNQSSVPDTVVDAAIARGLPWTKPTTISTSPVNGTSSEGGLRKVSDLLDMWAEENATRWGINADGEFYSAADPTAASWHFTPGQGQLGLADDEYASHLIGRYRDSASTYATASVGDAAAAARWGRVEVPVDLTSLGIITGTRATDILTGMLAKGRARLGWTNGLEILPGQLLSGGGTAAHLPFVRAGQRAMLHGILDAQLETRMSLSFVIGEARHRQDGSLFIAPVGLAARTLADVLSLTSKTGPRYGG